MDLSLVHFSLVHVLLLSVCDIPFKDLFVFVLRVNGHVPVSEVLLLLYLVLQSLLPLPFELFQQALVHAFFLLFVAGLHCGDHFFDDMHLVGWVLIHQVVEEVDSFFLRKHMDDLVQVEALLFKQLALNETSDVDVALVFCKSNRLIGDLGDDIVRINEQQFLVLFTQVLVNLIPLVCHLLLDEELG